MSTEVGELSRRHLDFAVCVIMLLDIALNAPRYHTDTALFILAPSVYTRTAHTYIQGNQRWQ